MLKIHTKLVDPPVQVAEALAHLNILHTDDNSYIESLIGAATRHVENRVERQLMPATWRLLLDRFPSADPIELRRPPIRSSGFEILYVDSTGAEQTLDASEYVLDIDSEPGRVEPTFGRAWPVTRCQLNAVTITFENGYADAASVPEEAKQAILLLVGHWYENREGVLTGTISKPVEFSLEALLDDLRWTR